MIPQHPSSPNILLNVMLAGLVSLVLSVGYLALKFGYARARSFPKPVREFSFADHVFANRFALWTSTAS